MPPVVRKDGKFQNGVEGGEVKASLKAEMSFHTSLISSPAMVWLVMVSHHFNQTSRIFLSSEMFFTFSQRSDLEILLLRWIAPNFVIEQLSPATKLLCWLRILLKKILFLFVILPTNTHYMSLNSFILESSYFPKSKYWYLESELNICSVLFENWNFCKFPL